MASTVARQRITVGFENGYDQLILLSQNILNPTFPLNPSPDIGVTESRPKSVSSQNVRRLSAHSPKFGLRSEERLQTSGNRSRWNGVQSSPGQ